jgi:ubiquinone biosynthesis protein COQ9
MTETHAEQQTAQTDPKSKMLEAALAHVPFDGWSTATFEAAVRESGVDHSVAKALCPRGAVDLAVAYHKRGDALMLAKLAEADLQEMRFRDRIAAAVRFRLEAVSDKEAVRRGTTLFALPQYAGDGAKLIWETADAIWQALGDTSEDVNWYTKRATLSGVYTATVLYWLGDNSADQTATWAFLDRRIDDVMQIEKMKAQVRQSPTLSRLMTGPNWLLSHIRAPSSLRRSGLPGSWNTPRR